MSEVMSCSQFSHNPFDGVRAFYYKIMFLKDNPRYFYPEGIWVFCGPQGSGKTLSAVQTAKKMHERYPFSRLISNIPLAGIDYEPFTGYEQISEADNGTDGVIFLLDELHVLWNSLESKQIPFSEMSAFCQMRKARRVIIGTSQVYGRIAKPIREQLKYVFECRNYFGILQSNIIGDPTQSVERNGVIAPTQIGLSWFFHSPEMYTAYDTLTKVERPDRIAHASDFAKEVILPYGKSRI